MRLYFDTAYIAKCYLNEADGPQVRKLARSAAGLYSSVWCVAELSCVFHRKVREGRLPHPDAVRQRELFLDDLRSALWVLVPVTEDLLFRVEAATRSLPSEAYVRAGDVVHLVTARDSGFGEIWTNDQHLLRAAEFFGLVGRSV